jgi:hypothetical protein
MPLALTAHNTDVSAGADDLPFVAAAGMLFFQLYYIAGIYF